MSTVGAGPAIAAGVVSIVVLGRAWWSGLATLRVALATPELRRVHVAWGAVALGKWAFFVLLAVYAFEQGEPPPSAWPCWRACCPPV